VTGNSEAGNFLVGSELATIRSQGLFVKMMYSLYSVGMRLRARKITALLAAAFIVFAVIPPLIILSNSWHRRSEAARLLTRAKMLRPGVATETETRNALSPFNGYLVHGWESISGQPTAARDSYDISNYPGWTMRIAPHLPAWVNERIWFLPYTIFSVSPRFRNGELVLLEVSEYQPRLDSIHPYAAILRVYSTNTETNDPTLPTNFAGFVVNPIEEVRTDENGKAIGSRLVSRKYVSLDERASSEQFARSFDFQLDCLTSVFGCQGAKRILAIGE